MVKNAIALHRKYLHTHMTFYGVIKLLSVLENMSIADDFDIRYVFPSSFGYIKILPHYPCDSLYSVLLSQIIFSLPKHS